MTTQIEELAKQLVFANNNGTLVPPLTTALSISDAYAVQRTCTHIGQTHSNKPANVRYETVGYKIGATNQQTLDLLGLSEPFHGPLHMGASYKGNDDVCAHSFSVFMRHNPRVEAEFVVGMKSDVVRHEKELSLEDIMDHIDWVAPGLEIVGSRFEASPGSRGTSVIADIGANQYMFVGKSCKYWRNLNLTKHPVSLGFSKTKIQPLDDWPDPTVHGHSGMSVFGNPLMMVVWLLNHDSMRGIGLKNGEWVSCGTCTGALPVVEGEIIAANFGELGRLVISVGAS